MSENDHTDRVAVAFRQCAARVKVPERDLGGVRRRIRWARRRRLAVRLGAMAAVAVLTSGGVLALVVGPGDREDLRTARPEQGDRTDVPRPLLSPRSGATSVPMPDGRVLTVGGAESSRRLFRDSQVFDPETRTFTEGPSLPEGRALAQGLVVDRTVVLVGGESVDGDAPDLLRLDAAAGRWSPADAPQAVRAGRAAVADGRLVVVGPGGTAASWDPQDGDWDRLPPVEGMGELVAVEAAPDGTVIVQGRAPPPIGVQIFVRAPGASGWRPVPAPPVPDGWAHDAGTASVAVVGDGLLAWGYATHDGGAGAREAAVAHLDLPPVDPTRRARCCADAWTSLDPIPARDVPDLWEHAVVGDRVVTWQVGGPAWAITEAGTSPVPDVPVTDAVVRPVVIDDSTIVRIDPGHPVGDPVFPEGTPPVYEVIDL